MSQSFPGDSRDEPQHSGEQGESVSGRHSTDGPKDDGRGHGFAAWLKEIITIIAIALLLSFLIKSFLFRAFFIPSESMEETLQVHDRIFVNLLVPGPFELERGDVVVFQDTKNWLPPQDVAADGPANWLHESLVFVGLQPDESQQHLVKRIIGMPGDRVRCCDAQGQLTINGEPIEEPYIYPGASPSDIPFDVTVPEGKIWVMGDHRNASADSRAHRQGEGQGFIDIEDVEGKAGVIAWPLNRIGILGSYPEVFDGVPAPTDAPAGSPVP